MSQASGGAPGPRVEQSDGPSAAVEPLAWLVLAALLLGRALAPAAPGIGVGLGEVVSALELSGSLASQLAAFVGVAVVARLVLTIASRGDLGTPLRLAAVALGGLGLALVLRAPLDRVDPTALLVAGYVATIVALFVALRLRRARAALALVPALVWASALARLAALLLLEAASSPARVAELAAGIQVACLALDLGVVLAALAHGVLRTRGGRRGCVIVAIGVLPLLVAMATSTGASSPLAVLWVRAAPRLALASTPGLLGTLGGVGAVCAALGLLTSRAPHAAAVALLVLSRGALDVPLCTLASLAGSLALVLTNPPASAAVYPARNALANAEGLH